MSTTSVPLPTLEDAKFRGRSVREAIPRSALSVLAPRPNDYDPVARLMWQGESRVKALLPLRYERMLASPLAFFRGGALLMAEDLARGTSTPIEVQICGDAHLSNFNIFSSPERRLVFDVNDFDESDIGPFEWDIKRLVASLSVASAQLGHSVSLQEDIALVAAREYRMSMRRFAADKRLDVWYAALDIDAAVRDLGEFFTDGALRRVDSLVEHANTESPRAAYERMVIRDDRGPRIHPDPPLLVPLSELNDETYLSRGALNQILAGYAASLSSDRQVLLSQFTPVDAARKVVGVGSVGTDCYVILLVGRDQADTFFLQIKEATPSVVAIARGGESTVSPGERVVRGQRLMQAASDVFLGWDTLGTDELARHFYVRQLYDNKASVSITELSESLLVTYGKLCAWVLARAHARGGRGAEIAGYLGKSETADQALALFATAYRDRTLQDYEALKSAVGEGRVTVAP